MAVIGQKTSSKIKYCRNSPFKGKLEETSQLKEENSKLKTKVQGFGKVKNVSKKKSCGVSIS